MRNVAKRRDARAFRAERRHSREWGEGLALNEGQPQLPRSAIIFFIKAIALPGFSPFGQVRVQFRMVWQR